MATKSAVLENTKLQILRARVKKNEQALEAFSTKIGAIKKEFKNAAKVGCLHSTLDLK